MAVWVAVGGLIVAVIKDVLVLPIRIFTMAGLVMRGVIIVTIAVAIVVTEVGQLVVAVVVNWLIVVLVVAWLMVVVTVGGSVDAVTAVAAVSGLIVAVI